MEILSENDSGRRLVHIWVGDAVSWMSDTIQATPTKEHKLPASVTVGSGPLLCHL